MSFLLIKFVITAEVLRHIIPATGGLAHFFPSSPEEEEGETNSPFRSLIFGSSGDLVAYQRPLFVRRGVQVFCVIKRLSGPLLRLSLRFFPVLIALSDNS